MKKLRCRVSPAKARAHALTVETCIQSLACKDVHHGSKQRHSEPLYDEDCPALKKLRGAALELTEWVFEMTAKPDPAADGGGKVVP